MPKKNPKTPGQALSPFDPNYKSPTVLSDAMPHLLPSKKEFKPPKKLPALPAAHEADVAYYLHEGGVAKIPKEAMEELIVEIEAEFKNFEQYLKTGKVPFYVEAPGMTEEQIAAIPDDWLSTDKM